MHRRRALPLALVGRRALELLAGQPAGSTDYAVTHDLRTPLRDGVVLLGDLYRPRGAGPLPVVLIRTPYGRTSLLGRLFAVVLARRGFQVFVQSVRGTFGSGGSFRPYTDEHEDGLDTLAWVRDQRWCDGRVATTGASYFGHTQWAVAPYADPPLVAASLHITGARVRDILAEHGVPVAINGLGWSDSLARQELPFASRLLGGLRLRSRLVAALATRPAREADVVLTGAPSVFWRDLADHNVPEDPFWDVADHDGAPLDRMPPVNMVTGWWDLFLEPQLRDVTRLQAAGVPTRITVGPWLHGAPAELKALLRSDIAWLEHHLHDGPSPQGAPVRLFLQEADTWLGFEHWPPEGTTAEDRFLQPDGALTTGAPPSGAAPSAFVFDPDDPTPFAGGPLLAPPGLQADDRASEARSDVLVFTGPAEAADLDLVGEVSATVFVRPELPQTDVFVRLCDVDPAGVSRNVVEGIRRLEPRTVPAQDVVVGTDGVFAVQVELFPTAYRIRAGHRLRVVVAGGAFPRYAINLGVPGPQADAVTGRRNRVEVFHDGRHPSRLHLSRIRPGSGHAGAAAPLAGASRNPA
ncbi:MAG: CocE/NonD family hydrolase [Acidobacteria bacterium]|nr:CocE/NonD family hydrolase [Acidobacteriota bacterium]